MQVVLIMFRADGERRSFSIVRDLTVIGRREDCDLRIPLGDVSRKHCRLIRKGQEFRIEDLGSSNGTYHNGQRVQEAVLGAGDTLQVGPVSFLVQIDGVPSDDQIQPGARPAQAGHAAAAPEEAGVPTEYAPPAPGEPSDDFAIVDEIPASESHAGADADVQIDFQPSDRPSNP